MAQLDDVLGSRDAPLTTEHLHRLPLLSACIREAGRLQSPVLLLPRGALSDFEFGGYRVAEGTRVYLAIGAGHRLPSVFAEPDRFDPDRFLPPREEDRRTPYALVTFGGGPRICLGINFAQVEVTALVAHVLRRYRLEPIAGPNHRSVRRDHSVVAERDPASGLASVVAAASAAWRTWLSTWPRTRCSISSATDWRGASGSSTPSAAPAVLGDVAQRLDCGGQPSFDAVDHRLQAGVGVLADRHGALVPLFGCAPEGLLAQAADGKVPSAHGPERHELGHMRQVLHGAPFAFAWRLIQAVCRGPSRGDQLVNRAGQAIDCSVGGAHEHRVRCC